MDETADRAQPIIKSKRMQQIEYHFDSSLEELLTGWYEEGLNPDRIAWKLTEAGFPCTSMCVRNWITNLGGRIRRRLEFSREKTAVS